MAKGSGAQPENLPVIARRLSALRDHTFDYFVRHGSLVRGPREFEYRDHQFDVRPFGPGWRVFIRTPGSSVLFNEVPRSVKPDSRDTVIQKAKELVDQRIRANQLELAMLVEDAAGSANSGRRQRLRDAFALEVGREIWA